MKAYKVSVIIPVYNNRHFLRTCMDCLFRQTCQDFEIILVNDGSSDGSEKLCEELALDYPERIQAIHQENTGVAIARNRGIEKAQGTYLMFFDNDDTAMPDYIETMLTLIESSGADMVVGGLNRIDESGKLLYRHELSSNEWAKFRIVAPWSRIMRRDFINNHHIRFGSFVIGEDTYFSFSAYNASAHIITTRYIGYNWIHHPKSISNTLQRSGNESPLPMLTALKKKNPEAIHMSRDVYEYFFIKFLVWHLTHIAKTVKAPELSKHIQQYFSWLTKHFPGYKRNPLLSPFRPKGELTGIRMTVWIFARLPFPLKKLLLLVFGLF